MTQALIASTELRPQAIQEHQSALGHKEQMQGSARTKGATPDKLLTFVTSPSPPSGGVPAVLPEGPLPCEWI